MRNIFISYARLDLGIVYRFYEWVKEQPNLHAWFDLAEITPQENWASEIKKGVLNCHLFVFMASRFSTQSAYVMDEWEYARELGKPILVIQIDNCEIPHQLHHYPIVDMRSQPIFKIHDFLRQMGFDTGFLSNEVFTIAHYLQEEHPVITPTASPRKWIIPTYIRYFPIRSTVIALIYTMLMLFLIMLTPQQFGNMFNIAAMSMTIISLCITLYIGRQVAMRAISSGRLLALIGLIALLGIITIFIPSWQLNTAFYDDLIQDNIFAIVLCFIPQIFTIMIIPALIYIIFMILGSISLTGLTFKKCVRYILGLRNGAPVEFLPLLSYLPSYGGFKTAMSISPELLARKEKAYIDRVPIEQPNISPSIQYHTACLIYAPQDMLFANIWEEMVNHSHILDAPLQPILTNEIHKLDITHYDAVTIILSPHSASVANQIAEQIPQHKLIFILLQKAKLSSKVNHMQQIDARKNYDEALNSYISIFKGTPFTLIRLPPRSGKFDNHPFQIHASMIGYVITWLGFLLINFIAVYVVGAQDCTEKILFCLHQFPYTVFLGWLGLYIAHFIELTYRYLSRSIGIMDLGMQIILFFIFQTILVLNTLPSNFMLIWIVVSGCLVFVAYTFAIDYFRTTQQRIVWMAWFPMIFKLWRLGLMLLIYWGICELTIRWTQQMLPNFYSYG